MSIVSAVPEHPRAFGGNTLLCTTTDFDVVSRRASFDVYKDGAVVEIESGEQMRANWHLMKMEIAYRDPGVFIGDKVVEAGVLLIPDYVSFPTLGRTENDVQAALEQYFDFSIPLFVWEYPIGDSGNRGFWRRNG